MDFTSGVDGGLGKHGVLHGVGSTDRGGVVGLSPTAGLAGQAYPSSLGRLPPVGVGLRITVTFPDCPP